MIASMTAFARETAQGEWGQLTWELRSVNHRYREIVFKIPDKFREWEQSWRHLAAKSLHRGKLDCFLNYFPDPQRQGDFHLNKLLLDRLLSHCQEMMQRPGVAPTVNAMEILSWPAILSVPDHDLSFLEGYLTSSFVKALAGLEETRQREGNVIKENLLTKRELFLNHVKKVREQLPVYLPIIKQRIVAKLEELQTTVDPQRVEQELVFFAQRSDIEEELERLETHAKEMGRIMREGGQVGRRLDFLMQEMGREVNTLASKTYSIEITQEAIELKVLLEQMREQIQNVE